MVLDSYLDDFHDRDWTTETDSEPIRFAMIGQGWWTREQPLPAVEATDNAVTTVLVSGDPDKANRVADDLPSVEATISYNEYEAGEASDAYGAVYIATPNALHRSHVERAANHGKAILCEKPMAASVEDAEAIVETCNAANVPLMIAYMVGHKSFLGFTETCGEEPVNSSDRPYTGFTPTLARRARADP
jgi:predicted dehydrogenase